MNEREEASKSTRIQVNKAWNNFSACELACRVLVDVGLNCQSRMYEISVEICLSRLYVWHSLRQRYICMSLLPLIRLSVRIHKFRLLVRASVCMWIAKDHAFHSELVQHVSECVSQHTPTYLVRCVIVSVLPSCKPFRMCGVSAYVVYVELIHSNGTNIYISVWKRFLSLYSNVTQRISVCCALMHGILRNIMCIENWKWNETWEHCRLLITHWNVVVRAWLRFSHIGIVISVKIEHTERRQCSRQQQSVT